MSTEQGDVRPLTGHIVAAAPPLRTPRIGRSLSPMSCPNSTESGCRCPEHHPGLSIRLVTPGPHVLDQAGALDQHLKDARAACPACQGNAQACNQGTGHPNYKRLNGCTAWTDQGAPAQAPAPPSQPWMPRPARRLAA